MFFSPPPDTRLAHKNRETSPRQRGKEGIHGPKCGDLTIPPPPLPGSPQTMVNKTAYSDTRRPGGTAVCRISSLYSQKRPASRQEMLVWISSCFHHFERFTAHSGLQQGSIAKRKGGKKYKSLLALSLHSPAKTKTDVQSCPFKMKTRRLVCNKLLRLQQNPARLTSTSSIFFFCGFG